MKNICMKSYSLIFRLALMLSLCISVISCESKYQQTREAYAKMVEQKNKEYGGKYAVWNAMVEKGALNLDGNETSNNILYGEYLGLLNMTSDRVSAQVGFTNVMYEPRDFLVGIYIPVQNIVNEDGELRVSSGDIINGTMVFTLEEDGSFTLREVRLPEYQEQDGIGKTSFKVLDAFFPYPGTFTVQAECTFYSYEKDGYRLVSTPVTFNFSKE